MEQSGKKRTRWIAVLLAIFSCGLLLWFLYPYLWKKKDENEEEDEYDRNIEFLNQQDLSLYVFGEKIPFRKALWLDRIKSIDEQTLSAETAYVVLIINDRHGKAKLSRKRAEWLKRYAQTHENFSYYYFGEEKLSFFRPELTPEELAENDDLSFGSAVCSGQRVTCGRIWLKEEEQAYQSQPEKFAGDVLQIIAENFKSNERDLAEQQ